LRWLKARSQTGELAHMRVDYNVDGGPKYPVELKKFDLGPETADSLAKEQPGWIRNGVLWQRKSG
jgi:hypothetical protein